MLSYNKYGMLVRETNTLQALHPLGVGALIKIDSHVSSITTVGIWFPYWMEHV